MTLFVVPYFSVILDVKVSDMDDSAILTISIPYQVSCVVWLCTNVQWQFRGKWCSVSYLISVPIFIEMLPDSPPSMCKMFNAHQCVKLYKSFTRPQFLGHVAHFCGIALFMKIKQHENFPVYGIQRLQYNYSFSFLLYCIDDTRLLLQIVNLHSYLATFQ